MAADLIIAPEAAQDIDEAYGWYEWQRSGLGDEFFNCVDACIQATCRTPEMHAKVYQDYRRALVRRFPYAVFYEYKAGTVTLFCVLHTSRDPEKWRQRLS
jgi:plasmid stabilization system protein ParE